MGKGRKKLSATFVDRVKSNGRLVRHSDGAGLYLIVRKSGAKSWSFIWIRQGIRREMGLGSADGTEKVTLAEARLKADVIREQLGAGLDPFAERDREKPKTFGEVADSIIAELRKGWKNPKQGAHWVRGMEDKCERLRPVRIDEITTQQIVSVLKPIYRDTPVTGKRLRGMIERVIDTATAYGWRTGDNPARWNGHLKILLGDIPEKKAGHFAAMPYEDVPGFLLRLNAVDTIAAKALQFTILTAARTSETLKASWSELDLENRLWNLPAERMKMKQAHTVPLSDGALDILNELNSLRTSAYVFPGKRPNRPLSNMSMAMVMRRMGIEGATVHGFRSSFKDWAMDKTNFRDDISEAALAHKISNSVKAAYRRGNALEQRTQLMQVWADYCAGVNSGEVVKLHG